MLDYIISSGTYGTVTHRVANEVKRNGGGPAGKLRYVFQRLYPPMENVKRVFPTFAKYRILLPFLPVYRLIRSVKLNKGGVKAEMKALLRHKNKRT